MHKTLPFILIFLFCPVANAEQIYSLECENKFKELVYNRIEIDGHYTVLHAKWWWIPGRILQGDSTISCLDWTKKSGVSREGRDAFWSFNKACRDIKKYSLETKATFECPVTNEY